MACGRHFTPSLKVRSEWMNWILVEVQLYKQLHPSQMTWDIFLPPQASVLKQQLTPVLNDAMAGNHIQCFYELGLRAINAAAPYVSHHIHVQRRLPPMHTAKCRGYRMSKSSTHAQKKHSVHGIYICHVPPAITLQSCQEQTL